LEAAKRMPRRVRAAKVRAIGSSPTTSTGSVIGRYADARPRRSSRSIRCRICSTASVAFERSPAATPLVSSRWAGNSKARASISTGALCGFPKHASAMKVSTIRQRSKRTCRLNKRAPLSSSGIPTAPPWSRQPSVRPAMSSAGIMGTAKAVRNSPRCWDTRVRSCLPDHSHGPRLEGAGPELTSSFRIAPPALEENRANDDQALDHLLRIARDVHEIHDVSDDAENEHAQQRLKGGSFTAGEARSADHHGGDRIQLGARSDDGRSPSGAAPADDSRDGGEGSGNAIDRKLVPSGANPRQPDRGLVAPDGCHDSSKHRESQEKRHQSKNQNHHEDRRRNPQPIGGPEAVQSRIGDDNRRSFGDDEGEAPGDRHHGKGG